MLQVQAGEAGAVPGDEVQHAVVHTAAAQVQLLHLCQLREQQRQAGSADVRIVGQIQGA